MSFVVSVQTIIDRVGDLPIDEVQVHRVPLGKPIMALLNLASQGGFAQKLKETPYDTLYHLYMTFRVNGQESYTLEKNEVIMLSRKKLTAGAQTMPVSSPAGLTLNAMLSKTRARMGDKFFTYNGAHNNCQKFIQALLNASGINTPEIDKFVVQDTKTLFDSDTRFRKLANTVTDVGKIVRENKTVDSAITKFQEQGKPIVNGLLDKLKSAKDALFAPNPFARFSKS